jgi:HTH-type transcriptional regulator/antitoxin HipB
MPIEEYPASMSYFIQTPAQLSVHLRALRQAKGLSQAALGKVLGVGQARIARIEADPTSISVAQLLKLLSPLGVQMSLSPLGTPELKANEPAAPPYDLIKPGEGDW